MRPTLEQVSTAVEAAKGNKTQAATDLGISRGMLLRVLAKPEPEFVVAPTPSAEMSIDDLVERRKAVFARKRDHEEATRLINVPIKIDGPVGILHMGDPHCLTTDHEVLTHRGWLTDDQLQDTDLVAGMDEHGGFVWQPILGRVRRWVSEKIVRVRTQHLALDCTTRHRVYAKKDVSGHAGARLGVHLAGDIVRSRYDVPTAALRVNQESVSLTDDQIRLLGWALTDATWDVRAESIRSITLTQAKPNSVAEIDGLLSRLKTPHTRRVRGDRPARWWRGRIMRHNHPETTWRLGLSESATLSFLYGLRHTKSLPDLVWRFSERQFDLLLETLVAADGSRRSANTVEITKCRPWIDQLQAVATAFGYRTRKIDQPTYSELRLKKTSWATWRPMYSHTDLVDYTGEVWCVTVPHGNFFTRLDGMVHLTGNCDDDGTDIAAIERHTKIVRETPGMMAGNIGDTTNNWVGRLARLYDSQSTTATEAWMLAGWMFEQCDWLYVIGGNHDAICMGTQCLTRRGWKFRPELWSDDQVLGLNTSTGLVEWQPILGFFDKTVDQLYRIESRNVSLGGSAGHRVMHHLRGETEWQYARADSIAGRIEMPISGLSGGEDYPIDDAWLRVLGWLHTDAGIDKHGYITFCQSEGPKADRLVEDLDDAGVGYTTRRRDRDIMGKALKKRPRVGLEFRLCAGESRRVLSHLAVTDRDVLPSWVWELSDRQFDVFFRAVVMADGTAMKRGREGGVCWVLYSRPAILDQMQAHLAAHGYATSIVEYGPKSHKRMNVYRAQKQIVEPERRWVEDGKFGVWCINVPLTNFLVRLNGKVHFTGNCWSGAGDPLKWIARQNGTSVRPSQARLNLQFPTGREVRIAAHHNFRGHSLWNTAHGAMKAAQMGMRDHILVNGHTHVSGYGLVKDQNTGMVTHCIQVASYKVYDRYAKDLGLADAHISPCVVTIIDPTAKQETGLVQTFWDPELAADYLTWMRKRA